LGWAAVAIAFATSFGGFGASSIVATPSGMEAAASRFERGAVRV
jgi:hypothetical protein